MAIDHHAGDRLVAHPGEVVGATDPGQPETREGHDTTPEAEFARHSRRRFLLGVTGASALFLVGGGTALALNNGSENSKPPAELPPNTNPTPEVSRPSFEQKDLTINNMALPETLDAETFPLVVNNLGQAIEYAVNKGDIELLRRLIPGGQPGQLQPGQFELRAAFIKGYRGTADGTINDDPTNPDDARYYPWGFKMELLEPLSRTESKPTDEEVTNFMAKIRITMGDLPPLITMENNNTGFEPPTTIDVDAELTRIAGLDKGGRYISLPNINGKPGRGWALASVSQMYPIPNIMAQNHAGHGFTEVPPLFK